MDSREVGPCALEGVGGDLGVEFVHLQCPTS